eukprot:CAMPEP_0117681542 /NCGR_PEP_ID=MMETSP0804-20121206/19049_1 /TAXON_ID=1074897 /ORGANISM="Tetraselmis astigmatica, Strain CCMP880" /LENGTH=127 /DNA_ID=CAMNT_0005491329 /DNA_START=1041 /DNA_END=1425 /DNA_ORIENTATION=-
MTIITTEEVVQCLPGELGTLSQSIDGTPSAKYLNAAATLSPSGAGGLPCFLASSSGNLPRPCFMEYPVEEWPRDPKSETELIPRQATVAWGGAEMVGGAQMAAPPWGHGEDPDPFWFLRTVLAALLI